MLGRFRDCSTVTGRYRQRELTISFTNAGGADAVSAMNGALLKALRFPRLLKAFRKFGPLRSKNMAHFFFWGGGGGGGECYFLPTIHRCSGPHLLLPEPDAVLGWDLKKMPRQGAIVAFSGDIITKKKQLPIKNH